MSRRQRARQEAQDLKRLATNPRYRDVYETDVWQMLEKERQAQQQRPN